MPKKDPDMDKPLPVLNFIQLNYDSQQANSFSNKSGKNFFLTKSADLAMLKMRTSKKILSVSNNGSFLEFPYKFKI